MCASAIRSRWPVVTPGLSAGSTGASTSATTRPASRIRAISALDLRVTISGALRTGARRLVDGAEHVRGHAVDRLETVDRPQDALASIVIDDVGEARQRQCEPSPDGLGLIGLALDERRAIEIADAGDPRGVRVLVVDVPRVR